MQNKTLFLYCFLLILPALFFGQVIEEIKKDGESLADPEEYPLGIYFKLGLPMASSAYETGHKNIHRLFRENGIDLPNFRPSSVLEVGMRYKRFYVELGGGGQWINSPIPYLANANTTVNSSYMAGWANVGVSVWQNRNSALLLRLGFGGAGYSYQIRSLQNIGEVDFENLFSGDNSASSSLIYHEDEFLDISVEFWKGRAKSRGSFGEAFRVGYRHGFKETAWEALDTSSINAPLDRMGELYLHFCFHLGYNYPKKSK